MQTKWKTYSICTFYAFCGAGFALFYLIKADLSNPPGKIESFTFVVCAPVVLLLALVKSAVSLKGISLLKKGGSFSPAQRIAFITGFVNNFVLIILVALVCLVAIDVHYCMGDDEGWEPQPWLDYKRVLPDFFAVLMLFCCIYAAVCDLRLLRALRRKTAAQA